VVELENITLCMTCLYHQLQLQNIFRVCWYRKHSGSAAELGFGLAQQSMGSLECREFPSEPYSLGQWVTVNWP
jgi:hypothetical protein